MPVFAAKAGGFFFIIFGVIMLIASFLTINPIWNYGPYDPSPVSAGTQPDWYIGFADGALRLMPGVVRRLPTLEIHHLRPRADAHCALARIGSRQASFSQVLFTYPWDRRLVTKDNREHHVLDHPP